MPKILPNGKGAGWLRDIPDFRDYMYTLPPMTPFLPDRVDLRSKLPEVRDQGALGSCTAFGVLAMVEYDHIRQGKRDKGQEFSELFLYYQERLREGSVEYDSGAYIRDGIKEMAKTGCCHTPLWPYEIDKFADVPSTAAYADAKTDRILLYYRMPRNRLFYQAALAWGDMFVFGFAVYESFFDIGSDGVMPWPNFATEYMLGGHAVPGCGYESIGSKLYIRCRNSWGPGFGDNGYFLMPVEYLENVNLSDDFWVIRWVR